MPAAISLSFMLVTIILIKKDIAGETAAVGLLTVGIFLSCFTVGVPVVSYMESQTPEQIVDAALYACTKSLVTRPDGDANLACSKD
jgi:hypothetical protein